MFLALCGELGAGKTTTSREITDCLECETLATSPTFSLFQEYDGGRLPVFHADLYRLGSEDELFDLGWDEILERFEEGLVLVEWADKFPECWPDDVLKLDFHYGQNNESRVLEITARGPRSERVQVYLERECLRW